MLFHHSCQERERQGNLSSRFLCRQRNRNPPPFPQRRKRNK
nr:MAG TPA_asm: hypothetical protein [Caudoviricetes sp.]DAU50160.1 MAG TPA: hypothetical protein [Caudoviricetes sp.]